MDRRPTAIRAQGSGQGGGRVSISGGQLEARWRRRACIGEGGLVGAMLVSRVVVVEGVVGDFRGIMGGGGASKSDGRTLGILCSGFARERCGLVHLVLVVPPGSVRFGSVRFDLV